MKDERDPKSGRWLTTPSLETTKAVPNPLAGQKLNEGEEEITRRTKKIWRWQLRFNRRDPKHWLLAAALLLLLLVLIWWGGRAIFTASKGRTVAVLTQKKNSVDWRPVGEVGFKDADIHQPFVANDAVKTGGESEAILGFGSGNELAVGENSLVIIRDADFDRNGEVAAMDLELSSGSLRGKASGNLRVTNSRGCQVEIQGRAGQPGEVAVQDGGEQQPAAVSVYSGQIKVVPNQGGALAVGPGKGVRFCGKEQPRIVDLPPRPTVIYPQGPVSYDLIAGQPTAVQFQLQPEKGVLYEVRIARDPAFRKVVTSRRQPFPRFSVPLTEAGRYFWDVALLRDDLLGPRTEPGTMDLVPKLETAPALPPATSPVTPSTSAAPPAVSFRVASLTGSLQLARGGLKPKTAALGSAVLEGDRLFVAVDGEGELSLRNAPAFRTLPYSELEISQLQLLEKSQAVQARLRLHKGGGLFYLRSNDNPGTVYDLVLGRHRLQLAQAKGGETRPAQIAVSSRGGVPLEARVYQGQVRLRLDSKELQLSANQGLSLDRRNKLSRYPLPPSRIVIREQEQPQVFFQSVSPPLTLTWKGKGGEVVVARDSNFSEPLLHERLEENYLLFFGPRPGVYFWKVRTAGEELFRESNSFAVIRTPLLHERTRKTVRAEDPVSTVNYSYQTPVIQFTWPPRPQAGGYEIEIYAGKELTQKTYQRTFPGHQFSFLADFLSEGEFYWRVNAITPAGTQFGSYSRLSLALDPDSPALEILEPSDNQLANGASATTRGQVLRQGRVEINGALLGTSLIGPFEKRLTLTAGGNEVVYKVLDRRDRLSYYYRLLVFEPA